MGAYLNLDPEGLQELLRCSPVLIDMRTDREVERGLIPDALHIPPQLLPAQLVYCRSGACSAQAGPFLTDNGCGQVYNIAGGFSAWVARGLPWSRTDRVFV